MSRLASPCSASRIAENLKHSSMLTHAVFASLALSVMPVSSSLANPEGGQVVAGDITMQQNGNVLNIYQGSNSAIINWQGFDILSGEATHFFQPGSTSIVLNRIQSGNATQILGQLTSNGTVVIVNANGVVFGAGAQVDVGGIVATTADINNADFMAGNTNFNIAGNPSASIINHGRITAAQGGLVALVAPGVQNNGIIQANMGTVALGSAQTVSIDFYGDGLYGFALGDATNVTPLDEHGNPLRNAVDNQGLISATPAAKSFLPRKRPAASSTTSSIMTASSKPPPPMSKAASSSSTAATAATSA